ncbi:MAG: hypothetical protein ACFCUQ_17945 [Kiloniellales bacterium]
MTTYTVQCGYAAYYANTVQVEAESLEAALEQAIEKANDDPHWRALDHCGPTFVDAVAEGADADPWSTFSSVLPIPDRFTEEGEPPTVTVIIESGSVQDVTVAGGRVRVLVKDYDTEGLDPAVYDIRRDEIGDEFTLTDRSP